MRRLLAMISATMLSVSPAFGETWTVVSEESFPPYNFVEEGRKTGIDTEIVNAVLKEIGVTSAHQGVPWNRVIAMLDQNQTDLAFQFVGTPERFEHYTLIGPHRVGHTVFATPTGSTLDYKTLEDLKGKTIGVVQGFSYGKEFNEAGYLTKDVSATNNETLVRKLAAKRYDLIIGDFDTLRFLGARLQLADQIRFMPKVYDDVPRYVAFPKARADKAERFRAGLEAVRARGEIDAILSRWSGRLPAAASIAVPGVAAAGKL